MVLIRKQNNQPGRDLLDFDQPFLGFSLAPFVERNFASLFPNVRDGVNMAIDIAEDKDNIVVTADLPGFKKDEVHLSLDNNILSIKGERKAEEQKKDKNYLRVERSYGVFERILDLGIPVDESKVGATYKDGVLEITLPKKERNQSKRIEIKPE